MPYDTNGNYSLPNIYYAISGTVINPAQHNTPFEDVQAALNRPLLRDGTAPMTGNLNANGNKITNLAKGTADTDAVTFAQLGGYLSLSTGGDITGKLTISKQPVVVGSSGDHSNYITTITYDTEAGGTGAFGYQDGTGTWRYAQPLGDYATSAQLAAETQRATNIESNLQSSKFDKTGGVISGGMTVGGSAGIIANYDPGGQTVGQFTNYAGIYSVAGGRGGKFGFYIQEHVGTGFNGVLAAAYPNGDYRALVITQGQKLKDTLFGTLAYTSDLGNYALLSQLPLDPSKIVLAWSGYVGGGDQSIPYPRGVSSVDTVVVACSRQVSGNKATAVINVQGWDNSSVQVNTVWVSGSSQDNSDTNYRAILVGNK